MQVAEWPTRIGTTTPMRTHLTIWRETKRHAPSNLLCSLVRAHTTMPCRGFALPRPVSQYATIGAWQDSKETYTVQGTSSLHPGFPDRARVSPAVLLHKGISQCILSHPGELRVITVA